MKIRSDFPEWPGTVDQEALLADFEKAAIYAMEGEGLSPGGAEISLSLLSREEIRSVNREYREVDKETDVLSFPQYEDLADLREALESSVLSSLPLGDVLLCYDVAEEQAAAYGHSLRRELVYLFVHSVLHLLGYDHMVEAEKKRMRQKEEAVMEKMELSR